MSSIKQSIVKLAKMLVTSRSSLKRPFTVLVEGNIGSGKTTFLEYFKKYNDICVLSEPIELWRNCNGHNLLGYMYEDPKKWCFSFQSYVQLTMLQKHAQRTPEPVKIMERSIHSARYCFVEKLAQDGIISSPEYAVLDEWFKWIINTGETNVDLVVYLRTAPEVVYDRVLKRSRAEEKTISLEYLQSLHKFHEDWLYHKTLHQVPAPVITLDANRDKSVIEEEYEKCEPMILNHLTVRSQAQA